MSLCVLFLLSLVASASKLPFQVATSPKNYGPDGPWQAVSVGIGTPSQPIDLYPGGLYRSSVFSTKVCQPFSSEICGAGGLFNSKNSKTFDGGSISGYVSGGGYTLGGLNDSGSITSVLDTLTLPAPAINVETAIEVLNFTIGLYTEANFTLADGGVYPEQLGQLSLGPSVNQSFSPSQGVSPSVNGSLVPGTLQAQGEIDSSSYGLHIGSAALNMPLSLWLGGYDESRLIGPVASGEVNGRNFFQIDLLDIGIGVESGASPFPYSSRQGILSANHSSLPVIMNAPAPYLSLPDSVCTAITHDLPVTYQHKYGLYFWNTTDARFARIVTSPSYLSFTFRATSLSEGNITIKVPFQLLNLTLSPPIIATSTAYFPCSPVPSAQSYSLGRAFLQAAFIGVNWSKQPISEWYLAQAPGPNIASSSSPVHFGDSVVSLAGQWPETWKNNWTPIPEAQPSDNPVSPSPSPSSRMSKGLSAGSKAGIGIGCAVFMIGLLSSVFYLLHKRKWRCKKEPLPINQGASSSIWKSELSREQGVKSDGTEIYEISGQGPIELSNNPTLSHELAQDREVHEILTEAF